MLYPFSAPILCIVDIAQMLDQSRPAHINIISSVSDYLDHQPHPINLQFLNKLNIKRQDQSAVTKDLNVLFLRWMYESCLFQWTNVDVTSLTWHSDDLGQWSVVTMVSTTPVSIISSHLCNTFLHKPNKHSHNNQTILLGKILWQFYHKS